MKIIHLFNTATILTTYDIFIQNACYIRISKAQATYEIFHVNIFLIPSLFIEVLVPGQERWSWIYVRGMTRSMNLQYWTLELFRQCGIFCLCFIYFIIIFLTFFL